ncbi:HigA family addiction module antitoxin [Luteibacter aegosomaticola]|uniref:HigA family addiction module antitoxin n=1 Tax=Luteibacter aegosomaticola TaxID=2911538 RepID=UPI001FFC039E|nr:HigA family addiction module antitoxin [Luteibacter aegosomaticola]UPG91365.1 HigA family addiction module antitoxin [Luteibacter aegosomaticola]
MARDVPYPHPGEILQEEFLTPMGITKYRLAKAIGVPAMRIGEIIAGRRAVTVDTGLRLSRFFGQSEDFWLGLQDGYDRAMVRPRMAEALAAIVPWAELQTPSSVTSKRRGKSARA